MASRSKCDKGRRFSRLPWHMQKFNYRAPRISTDFPIRLALDEALICGRCTDIGEDGLGAALPQLAAVGTVGAVILVSPVQEIEVRAQIVAHSDLEGITPTDGMRGFTVLSSVIKPLIPEVELQGRVAHCGFHRTGIAFVFRCEEEREMVRRFIATVPAACRP
jgi:hypothetical protein